MVQFKMLNDQFLLSFPMSGHVKYRLLSWQFFFVYALFTCFLCVQLKGIQLCRNEIIEGSKCGEQHAKSM